MSKGSEIVSNTDHQLISYKDLEIKVRLTNRICIQNRVKAKKE